MTTTVQFKDDDFDEVERGIDWLERLEGIKARRDKEAALRETVEYVDALADGALGSVRRRHRGRHRGTTRQASRRLGGWHTERRHERPVGRVSQARADGSAIDGNYPQS